ncbi:hypothetical protein ACFPJ8_32855 [Streptomyces fildesensis]
MSCVTVGTLYFASEQRGRLVDKPAPIDFAAPASRCEPIEGQAYEAVPTERESLGPAF